MWIVRFIALFLLLFNSSSTPAESPALNLCEASILIEPGEAPQGVHTAAVVLSEEIEKRTGRKLGHTKEWPSGNTPVILITRTAVASVLGHSLPVPTGHSPLPSEPESFRVCVQPGPQPVVWIIGNDARGCLFGVGWILRSMVWGTDHAVIQADVDITSAPVQRIRGHQLGYRATANSWDAWTPEQFDQYIRELVIFGANAIENIPFQDNAPSPLMKLPREEMNIRLSEICARYDIDHWIWTPATFPLEDQKERAEALDRHEGFYAKCPRLDGVFFPGGDPGDNPPELVLPFLKDIAERLERHHPQAGVWLSMQGFTPKQVDTVYEFLEREKPAWLRGLVAGPSSPSIPETRRRLPANYQLRDYPDITHVVRCQYPVPWLDPAFSITSGREAVNPRPLFYSRLIRFLIPFTDGFISYSDGVHDDVNKAVWSQLTWDPTKPVREVLVEYARFFFGPRPAGKVADGILALENNWNGNLAENGAVDSTYATWSDLDHRLPEKRDNWRWLALMFRANYDYYIRHRLLFENQLEQEANLALSEVRQAGSTQAMSVATDILARADTERPLPEVHKEIETLAEQLFQEIRLQTSVAKYQASGAERGAVMDFLDRPLNNRWWLEDQFKAIALIPTEEEKTARLEILANWENPGLGSFYDDVGHPGKSDHVIRGETVDTDPTLERNPPPTYMWWDEGLSRTRLSWPSYMDWPMGMRYEGLLPHAEYLVRLTGQGESKLRIDGELVTPGAYPKEIGGFKEFPVPKKALEDGVILLTWDKLDESQMNWRKQSHLAEVWLMRMKR
jgi:hypothetical protein